MSQSSIFLIMNEVKHISFFEVASKVLKALGHPERLRIVEYLQAGERNVGDIQREIGLSQPITSQHLRYMQRHNILTSRREGTRLYYFLASDLIRKLLDCMHSCKVSLDSGDMQVGDIFPEIKRSI
ncbi:MAG: winged helix-turn-helix transcriptional regulator [Candidatus Marinimicrobia bacterium]|nr:winged helix-turn-helix transcriptional regulator [Candidatus Neomarinimicrobiota bacterium]MBT3679568.1 winged helix-turn-helix transcriptional regulator [Candidatus Neomarinimicrobiota bacterium]MBT3950525.1 winged helix-turn-helix transcriptional regulator [Candidatus Neomarinimicrobiota bacterium]MBT4253488.1 winged helix-turn-helix transcriptional regulator [Candidatus Neomarinimicrobiota bacterium]MBT4481823.1 winged helix-turn-helix transcriptional regulator [Candidatus Neomarinimicro